MNGFVIVCDSAYKKLLDVLIDGLLAFTQYEIDLGWLDDAPLPDYGSRVRTRRIEIKSQKSGDIFLSKLFAVQSTHLEFGVLLDVDIVPNRNIGEWVKLSEDNPREYPICPFHPGGVRTDCSGTMAALGVTAKSQPHSYANYAFSPQSKGFFNSCDNVIANREKTGVASNDEVILNVMLWKMGVKEQTTFCIPHPFDVSIGYVANTLKEPLPDDRTFHGFHGAKSVAFCWHLLNFLKSDQTFDSNPIRSKKMKLLKYK